MEFAGSFVLGILIALAAAAGIGGGGIVVPICIIFFGFSTTGSIALSNFNIFVASITRFVYNFRERHPIKKRVSINYEVVMIMLPVIMLGSLIGVQINSMLPDAVILILLVILLIFIGFKSTKQGISKFRQETKEIK